MFVPLALVVLATGAGCKRDAAVDGAPVASAPVATPQAPAPKPSAATNAKFPTLKVNTLDGQAFDLAAQRGKWAIVNFWATWCGPCLKEIPDLDAFDKSREDVDVIGLAYEDIERADMEAFLKKHPMSYPISVLDLYKPPADFETPRGLPTTYLIAPDGKVAKHFVGPVTSEDLLKAMNQHGQAPAA